MNILSNMYRDKEFATLREYVCNAHDSHIAAANPAPFEVTLPTDFEPTLTVSDNGTGLSEQELLEVFAPYGTSTKRDTNDQIGAFGIGAKAAFTLTTQFTVTAVKDGMRTSALFALNADGIPTRSVISRDTVSDPNGVTVRIAVPDVAAMRAAAEELFSTWPRGTVVVDGHEPATILDDALAITDTIVVATTDREPSRRGLVLLVGGVAYDVPKSMLQADPHDHDGRMRLLRERLLPGRGSSVFATVPIGSVDVTPSRDDLRDTARTLAVVDQVVQSVQDNLGSAIQRALDDCPSAAAASTLLCTLPSITHIPGTTYTWRGSVPAPTSLPFVVSLNRNKTRTETHDKATERFGSRVDDLAVVVTPDPVAARSGKLRRLARDYLAANPNISRIVFAADPTGQFGWITYGDDSSPVTTVTADDYIAAATRRSKAVPRQPSPVTYAVRDGRKPATSNYTPEELRSLTATRRVILDDLNTKYPAIRGNVPAMRRDVIEPTDLIVALTGRQQPAAFVNRVPGTYKLSDLLNEYATSLLDAMTDLERAALTVVPVPTWWGALRPQLQPSPVLDALNAAEEAENAQNRVLRERRNLLREAHRIVGSSGPVFDMTEITELYPLLVNADFRTRRFDPSDVEIAHYAAYVNAVTPATPAAVA